MNRRLRFWTCKIPPLQGDLGLRSRDPLEGLASHLTLDKLHGVKVARYYSKGIVCAKGNCRCTGELSALHMPNINVA